MNRTATVRRAAAAAAIVTAATGLLGAHAVAAPAGATSHGACPATEITAIWYGGESDDGRCDFIPDYLDHLFYSDPMLTTAQRNTYQVRAVVVQLRLRDLGYRPVAVDGKYGPQTAGAVTRLQENRGLYVDGKVGVQTWKSLFGLGRA